MPNKLTKYVQKLHMTIFEYILYKDINIHKEKIQIWLEEFAKKMGEQTRPHEKLNTVLLHC